MAVRLSVIMVHTPPRGIAAQELSEAIVGELIGLPGIDLTLIGPIESLADSSTDRLTLDSLSGDVALLDWHSPEESIAALNAIGFAGQRTSHAEDTEAPAPSSERRIYAFNLNRYSRSQQLVAALLKLRDHRQVRTVSLGLTPPARRTPSPDSPSPESPSESRPQSSSEPRSEASSGSPSSPSQSRQPVHPRHSIDLDQLLDQLDELDP